MTRRKKRRRRKKCDNIIPTIAFKIVWKEKKLPDDVSGGKKSMRFQKSYFFYIEPLSISDLKDMAFDVGKHNNNATAKEG